MKKGGKRRGASKAGGRKGAAVAESQNDEGIADSLEASTQEESQQQPKEDVAEENGEEAKENQEEPDSSKQVDVASSSQPKEDPKEEEDGDKKKPAGRPRGGKRKRATTKKDVEVKDEKKPAPRAKKARVAKPEEEPEYFEDERNLEGLWKAAFPVGTEWDKLDAVYEFNWDFKNLEEALEEGGLLHGKKVFVFGCTEPQLVPYKGANKIVLVPAVVAVESPFPPSDKIGVTSVQREVEEILPMKTMKMDWLPYIPFDKRGRQVDRMNFQIFVMTCTQRRAALRHMKEDRVKKYEYCLPYFYQPFKEDELEQSTEVQIMFPSEPPVVCEFDWEFDELEEFVDKLIAEEALPAEQKDEFKEYVKEQVRAAKKANREAREARKKAIEDMSEDTKQAFQSMKFYKFYPQPSPETPDVSGVKSPFINRYYGKAHQVL
ncbi:Protein HEAT INTOLERANT 4 [Hirschfeldia incana]|nr:Protein HEAT INTOLERANT 4 [Hirschfeldia incana]KAJ0266000.1 Protein HEAT INTOLERANT 4 [Hirschfeldia incana]KAJ0266001.1 Protein HEAT INTOLERANT 4 [Hirschfeldia incana]